MVFLCSAVPQLQVEQDESAIRPKALRCLLDRLLTSMSYTIVAEIITGSIRFEPGICIRNGN